MRKSYKLEELECANCAAKMENAINKLDGVKKASISFMAQKLTIEIEDQYFDEVMKKVPEIIRKIEPDCRIVM